MPRQIGLAGLVVVVLVVVLGISSMFTVDIRERSLLLRLGETVREDLDPGLHFKIPLIDTAYKFDGRLQTLSIPPERFLTVERKNLIVDFYVKWRIDDVGQYYRSTGGGQEIRAQQRLEEIVKDGLRDQFGQRTVEDAVSGERAQIMEAVTERAGELGRELGILVREVRIKRIDLPQDVSVSVFERMQAERAQAASELRALGAEEGERIRADADRQSEVIRAEAHREGERIRGEGDARAAETYASAFQQDTEFYSFYRSLGAYRSSLGDGETLMVLDPDDEFFRYFNQMR